MLCVLKVFKINLLSLVALPLFALSILAKLLQKALEKALFLLCICIVLVLTYLLSLVIMNPDAFFSGLGTAFAAFILFGAIIAIVGSVIAIIGSVASVAFAAVVMFFSVIFTTIHTVSHHAYAKLYDTCTADFVWVSQREPKSPLRFFCIFWFLLKGFSKIVITLLSFGFAVSVVGSIAFVGYSVYSLAHTINTLFGIGVIEYLKLFPTASAVFSIIYFAIIQLGVVMILLTLGAEWSEWGDVVKVSTKNYSEYCRIMAAQSESLEQSIAAQQNIQPSTSNPEQDYRTELDAIRALFDDTEELQQRVSMALSARYDSALAYEFSSYVDTLNEISKTFALHAQTVPVGVFEGTILPLFKQASKQSEKIEKQAVHIIFKAASASQKQQTTLDFFAGCETADSLKKRYRALSQIYHPDVGGSEETFQILSSQYEAKKQQDTQNV